MLHNRKLAMRCYLSIFNYVAQNRLKKNDVDPRIIHSQVVVVFTTGLLMWAYAFLAHFFIASPIPGVVGFICALIHSLSPLLFRYTNNPLIPTSVFLLAGIIHQSTFSFFSGGFESNVIIWFGILPMIGGVICGKREAILWQLITLSVALIFFLLHVNGFQYPNLITPTGRLWSRVLLVFGWIFLSGTIVIVYAGLREHTEKKLQEQGQRIDDLFRIMFHDLANPIGRISIGLTIAKRHLTDPKNIRGLEIAKSATDSMIEITQNVRKIYAVSKGKANGDLSLTSLNASVDYIMHLYASKLESKKIKIHYHFAKNEGLYLMVEPMSFNNQVMGNIISNAIKFSPENGQIYLTVYPVNHDTFKIEVRDNGIGMSQTLLDQLFDLNKKTTRPGTAGETGTGFGLHIMKSFVEMYGGKLLIESKEAKKDVPSGTTVNLILKGEWK